MSKAKIDIVTALAETFGRTLTAAAVKLYVSALAGITDQDATKAASIAVQRCKFFPAASELLELARTSGVGFEAQAMVAFEQLEAALNANRPSMMPPLVAAIANQLGGFGYLRDMPVSEFTTWKRKEFLAAYTTIAKENPERLAAIGGPTSGIALALKKVPDRAEISAEEETNRRVILSLTAPPAQ